MGVVELFPEAELCLAFQRSQLGVFQHKEDLVGGGVHKEAIALCRKPGLQAVGGVNSVFADGEIQAIGEQHVKLDAQQPPLCQQCALLLDHGHKMRRCAVGEHHSLAAQRTHLGAADVEHIGQPGKVGQRHVRALGSQTVAQPCTIEEQRHLVLLTHSVQGFQLRLGVQGAVLGGVGDVYHAGEHHVVVVVVGVEGGHQCPQLGSVQLAVVLGQGDDLVAGVLDGTCLVPGYMTGGSSHYALPPLQHGRDDDGVALGAAGDELHIGLRAGAGGADLLAGAGAVGVGAVAGDLFKVGLGQLLQNGGVCTLAVVVFKIQHGKTLLYIIVRKQYLYSTSPRKPCQIQNRAQRTQGTAKTLTGYPVRHYVDRNYSLRQLFFTKV